MSRNRRKGSAASMPSRSKETWLGMQAGTSGEGFEGMAGGWAGLYMR